MEGDSALASDGFTCTDFCSNCRTSLFQTRVASGEAQVGFQEKFLYRKGC